MKKILFSILSIFSFWFLFSIRVDAIDYNGNLGYDYTYSSTTFWFVIDNDDIDRIELYLDSDDEYKTLSPYSDGVYIWIENGDLNGKEYYYKICYTDSNCIKTLDPFSKSINKDGTKNIVLSDQSYFVLDWDTVNTISTNVYNSSIYAIEADKFVEQLKTPIVQGGEFNDSVFAKLVANDLYIGNPEQQTYELGYTYLSNLGVKYIEIGNLYDKNNYYFPNLEYSSADNNYSAIKELKNMIIGYKNTNMNTIARMSLLKPSEELKTYLLNLSSDYVTEQGVINIDNPMMKRYIKSVYEHWVKEFKVDGFYIEDANLYGEQYLLTLIQELQNEYPQLFIYTNSNQTSKYYTSNELQETLIGSLLDSKNEGILYGNFSEQNFDKLVNAMFGGYYSDTDKYEQATFVINNIGSLSGLDIYSKIKLIDGLAVSESEIINKIKLLIYTIVCSTGIPRIIAGNEFFNISKISSDKVDTVDDNKKVCMESTKLCYATGEEKILEWSNLQRNENLLNLLLIYRENYIYQYPSQATMKFKKSISYNKELTKSGILVLNINYDPKKVGDIERSLLIINYSGEDIKINSISDRDYGNVSPINGRIEKDNDKTKIGGFTIFTLTETKVNNIPNWVYVLITAILLVIIFGGRAILIRLLKEKRGINYNEYSGDLKEEKRRKRKEKKKKEKKEKTPGIFAKYLDDESIFSRFKNKKEKQQETSNEEVSNKEEDE